MKRITRRQQLMVLLLFLTAICGVLGVWKNTLVPVYLAFVWVLLGLFIVLRSSERGQYKGFRKIERLQRQFSDEADKLDAKLDSLGSELSIVQGTSETKQTDCVEVDALMDLFDGFISEMNEHTSVNSRVTLSQQVSIKKVIDWLQPSLVLTTDVWSDFLRDLTRIEIANWLDPAPSLNLDGEVKLAVVDNDSFIEGREALMVSNHLRGCALIIIDSPCAGNVQSITGYEEVAPVGMMHGVRLFYPSSALAPLKYSKLLKYS